MSYNYPSFEDIVPKYLHTQLQSSNMHMNKANLYQEKIYSACQNENNGLFSVSRIDKRSQNQ